MFDPVRISGLKMSLSVMRRARRHTQEIGQQIGARKSGIAHGIQDFHCESGDHAEDHSKGEPVFRYNLATHDGGDASSRKAAHKMRPLVRLDASSVNINYIGQQEESSKQQKSSHASYSSHRNSGEHVPEATIRNYHARGVRKNRWSALQRC